MRVLKILQIINALPSAGAEKLVVETSKRFVQRGHKAAVLLLSSEGSSLIREIEQNPQIDLHVMNSEISIYNPKHCRNIARHLKNHSYDIIHVHLFPSFYWAGIARKAAPNTTFIHTEHNTNNRRMGNALYRTIDGFIYKRYNYHIAISEAVRENLENHINTRKNKVVTIYNGIDLHAVSSAEPYPKSVFGLKETDRIVLQVSAFRPQKNQLALIEAINKLDSHVHLLLAGDGVVKDKCMARSRALGLEDRVHFLGVRDDVPRLLKTADVVVLSSHYEGLSLASVEGLASGKPFVASDVPGLTEVVKDAGILFPDGDSQTLAATINSLLSDPKYHSEIAERCLKRSKIYDMEIMVDNYLALYQKALT